MSIIFWYIFTIVEIMDEGVPHYDQGDAAEIRHGEEMRQAFSKNGINGVKDYYHKKNNEWKNLTINMGVTGQSGVGKSSFINAIRGLRSRDQGGAPVGVNETTTVAESYPHPDNEKLLLWDLPGVGTQTILKDTYLNMIEVDKFDSFLILTTTRFYENDAWLGTELAKRKKAFYFVRTKIQNDVRVEKEEPEEDFSEEMVVEKIRRALYEQLKSSGLSCKLFLIDNHKKSKFDFEALMTAIIRDFSLQQREAAILTLASTSQSVIKEKADQLRKRAWRAAIASACIADFPFPGLSVAFDVGIIIEEGNFYYKQLGLDEKSLEERAITMSTEVKSLIEIVRREFPNAINFNYVKSLTVGAISSSTMVTEEVGRFIPIIGSLIASPISLYATHSVLLRMIDRMEKISFRVDNWKVTRHCSR